MLAAKGYHYQFVFARNAHHVDRPVVAQTLPAALEWLWRGYPDQYSRACGSLRPQVHIHNGLPTHRGIDHGAG